MEHVDLQKLITPLLPEPCSVEQADANSVTLTGGDPGEVIVRITAPAVEVLAFAVEWHGPHTPVVTGTPLATLNPSDLTRPALLAAVVAAIEKARTARLATYRTCVRCDETKPPEWMHDARTCQRCAERALGVVY